MKIFMVARFKSANNRDEKNIAESFERLGHDVLRIDAYTSPHAIADVLMSEKPDILLFMKYDISPLKNTISESRKWGMKTVCWLFDIYIDYEREYKLNMEYRNGSSSYFSADFVMSTDGGHYNRWIQYGVNHRTVRQGIFEDECFLSPLDKPEGVVFVGTDNQAFPERHKMINKLSNEYEGFEWFGKDNPNEIRGTDLNRLFARKKVVVGDSYYSPYYWSNRVVETLGRGGFLIHQEVPGLKEEYPYLVTYKRGDYEDLKSKIDYYLTHEKERQEIVKKNHAWVKKNYTMDKQCQLLLNYIK